MARKKHRYFNRQMTLPMAIITPIASSFMIGAAEGYKSPIECAMAGDWAGLAQNLQMGWTFYNPYSNQFDLLAGGNYLKATFVGALVHKGASMLGINRALARAKVPFFRV